MSNITLAVPEELHKKMKKYPEFKWSEIARKAIEEKINDQEFLEDLKHISVAEKSHSEKKTISFKKALKELGLKESDL